ncbi:MAG: mRNA-degrading endonuclease RelE, toxin component of the RelBE toxin-antitoxin system [Lacunisphaera sp.]|nr:mRNA-degrading endonuclease RelE, toxin component of the RelBE toxin-antitoxin system [Lacunisphaera sp.]
MKTEVIIREEVRDYLRTLAPETRRRATAALRALPAGDTKALREELDGFHRLRVGDHRFIYRHHAGRIRVFYAAPRSIVYEYLAAHLREYLG